MGKDKLINGRNNSNLLHKCDGYKCLLQQVSYTPYEQKKNQKGMNNNSSVVNAKYVKRFPRLGERLPKSQLMHVAKTCCDYQVMKKVEKNRLNTKQAILQHCSFLLFIQPNHSQSKPSYDNQQRSKFKPYMALNYKFAIM